MGAGSSKVTSSSKSDPLSRIQKQGWDRYILVKTEPSGIIDYAVVNANGKIKRIPISDYASGYLKKEVVDKYYPAGFKITRRASGINAANNNANNNTNYPKSVARATTRRGAPRQGILGLAKGIGQSYTNLQHERHAAAKRAGPSALRTGALRAAAITADAASYAGKGTLYAGKTIYKTSGVIKNNIGSYLTRIRGRGKHSKIFDDAIGKYRKAMMAKDRAITDEDKAAADISVDESTRNIDRVFLKLRGEGFSGIDNNIKNAMKKVDASIKQQKISANTLQAKRNSLKAHIKGDDMNVVPVQNTPTTKPGLTEYAKNGV